MTAIELRTDEQGHPALRIIFPGWEQWMTGRHDYTIPCSRIAAITVESDWTSEILGMRRGLAVSGLVKVAWFTHPNGTRRLVAMRRGLPLLRLRLRDHEVDEVLVSTPEAARLRDRLCDVLPQDAA